MFVACGNGVPTFTLTSAAPTAAPAATAIPALVATPEPQATAAPSPTATTAPAATSAPVPTATTAPVPTSTPAPTAAPAATAVPAATAAPAPTAPPTSEPTATPLPEPTVAPKQFTNVDDLGFSLRLDGEVDVQSAGWTEAEPNAGQGSVSFATGGVNVILIWSPAGDQTLLNFLADTYTILRTSQPDITFEAGPEGEITVSQQGGVFGSFITSNASGTTLGGGLNCDLVVPIAR